MRPALGKNLRFYTSVAKRLKLKVRMFLLLIPTFVEVTGEKLVGEAFLSPPPYPPGRRGFFVPSGPLNNGGIADLPLLRTILAVRQKS